MTTQVARDELHGMAERHGQNAALAGQPVSTLTILVSFRSQVSSRPLIRFLRSLGFRDVLGKLTCVVIACVDLKPLTWLATIFNSSRQNFIVSHVSQLRLAFSLQQAGHVRRQPERFFFWWLWATSS